MARRRRMWAGGAVLIAVAVAATLANDLPMTPLEILGGAFLAASGLLLVLGSVVDSVSVGPLTLPSYGLIGSGFVSLGGYMLAAALASTGGSSLFWSGLLPGLAGLCSCWIGVQYARGSEHVGLEPEGS